MMLFRSFAKFLLLILVVGCGQEHKSDVLSSISKGNIEEVKGWLASGGDVNRPVSDDWTPLAFASKEGQLEIVKFLVDQGADVNATEGGGNTPLFWAAFYGRGNVVEYLLTKNADPCLVKHNRMSAREIAEKKGFEQLLKVLPECGIKDLE